MVRRNRIGVSCLVGLFLGAIPLAGAQEDPSATEPAEVGIPLFLVDSTFEGARTRIFEVDPLTGTMEILADLGTHRTPVLGMAAADARTLFVAATDPSGSDRCEGQRSCVLVRITLDAESAGAYSEHEIGPIRSRDGVVGEIVGLTFGSDGLLYASSQRTSALYVIDPDTAEAREVGPFGVPVDGGDLSFDDAGRLLLWNNLGDLAGLYDVDPVTGTATVFESHPGLAMAGMAALAHSQIMYAASPPSDLLYEIDSVVGLKRSGAMLTWNGARFDHKRGDMDSPYCSSDVTCDDGDACTVDRCGPGGCEALPVDLDDGDACTLDSCDPAEGPIHLDLRLLDTDGDGIDDCVDLCPDTERSSSVNDEGCSVDQLCPCDAEWPSHGAYMACVIRASERTREGRIAISLWARKACGFAHRPATRPGNPHRETYR